MSECPICDKHRNLEKAVFEDEHWIVTHGPLDSQILGYLYLEPKRHVENWSDLSHKELLKVGPLFKSLEEALKKELDIDRVYTVTISEAVRHLHFHIIPREKGNEVKGLPLIEQATQQKISIRSVDEKTYTNFIQSLGKYF